MICGCGIGSDRIEVCAFPPTVSLILDESVWAGLRFVLSHPLCVAEIERIGLQRIDVCAFSTPFLPVKKNKKKGISAKKLFCFSRMRGGLPPKFLIR